jgi:WD40 repeat protein
MASGAWQNGTEYVGRVWDLATGKELFRLVGHTASVGGIAWTPDGKRIVSGGNDGHLIVWNAQTGKLLKRIMGTTSAMWSIALSPDGVSANTSRTKKCAHADKCQYIPNRAISPGTHGWADDNPLRGSAADWSIPCGEE